MAKAQKRRASRAKKPTKVTKPRDKAKKPTKVTKASGKTKKVAATIEMEKPWKIKATIGG